MELGRRAQRYHGKARASDFEHRDATSKVLGSHLSVVLVVVKQAHPHGGGTNDDVIDREDVASRVDECS